MIELSDVLKRREGVLTQQAVDKTVLLNVTDGQYYALDEISSRVWELCDGQRNVGQVIDTICQEYDAPAATISADVHELLEELADAQLMVQVR